MWNRMVDPGAKPRCRQELNQSVTLKKTVGSKEETEVHRNQYIPRMRRFTQWMRRFIFGSPSFRVLPCLPWICKMRFLGRLSRVATA